MIAKTWFGQFRFFAILFFFFYWNNSKGRFLSRFTKMAVIVVFFGRGGWFPNTQTKEPVCEAESSRIHLCWAEQACWQGNTSGEGQPSTLWLCWRQWHNSNTCRVHASSSLNLLSLFLSLSVSLSLWQAAHKTRNGARTQTELSLTKWQNNYWSGILSDWKRTK